MNTLTLVSHPLCPYVQRAAISLAEKGVQFERLDVDLADKPHWFNQLSPLGKVPLLRVSKGTMVETIFESAVILEYLEETQPNRLHPSDPLERARHRSWIEFGSSILSRIGSFYNAKTEPDLRREADTISGLFTRVEPELQASPWFAGPRFSLVDATFGPIFRYFDTIDKIENFSIFTNTPKVQEWRNVLAERSTVRDAVAPDYAASLLEFLKRRNSALSKHIPKNH